MTNVLNKLIDYLRDSWREMKRVSWPTRSQSLHYTIIVIGITFVAMVYLGVLDTLFSWLYLKATIYFQNF